MNLHGSPLTERDYQALEARWIDRIYADEALIRHLNELEGGILIGRNGGGDWEGMGIPYFRPGEEHIRAWRLRLERPPVKLKNGKEVPDFKYLAAPGDRNKIYFPRRALAAWLDDATIRAVFVEGELKTIALWRLAEQGLGDAAEAPRFLPLGLPGVANWQGQIGIATDAQGRRVPKKGPIPDLDLINWKDRHVTIVFDRDAQTNEYVLRQRNEFARELRRRGAKVFLFIWPVEHALAKGIDDLLAAAGPDLVFHLLSQAESFAKVTNWQAELIVSEKGLVKPLLANAVLALREASDWQDVLGWDDFGGRITAFNAPFRRVEGDWTDNDDRLTAIWLQKHGIHTSTETAAGAVATVALENSFHPVRDFLESLEWDGVARLDDWLTLYLGVDPSDYVRAVGARWMISAIARIYRPGCKADCCLILEGPQGIGKSRAVKTLAGEWFTDDVSDFEATANAAMQIMRVWIVELSELDSIRKSEASKIKAFISRSVDKFRPPYGRHVISAPRQCVFVGTVNESQYLRDATGGRRFWPVVCGEIKIADLELDREQLWAEAVHRFKAGEAWWFHAKKLLEEAEEEQAKRYEQDPWQPIIEAWLRSPYQRLEAGRLVTPYESDSESVTITDVLIHGIPKRPDLLTPSDYQRAAKILKILDWTRFKSRAGHSRAWRYRSVGPEN